MELAVLDLGSTTFHLQHIRVVDDGTFRTVLDHKRTLCLGTPVFADGYLNDRCWNEALEAITVLLEISSRRAVSARAVVATSAIRSAGNGAEWVSEIERRFGLPVRVLEPYDEARLAYLGQSTSPVVGGRRVAAIDLGGGSVEIAVGAGTRCIHAASLPLGALRMHATTSPGKLVSALRRVLSAPLAEVRALEPEIIVFGSGSARAARALLTRETALPGKTGPIEASTLAVALEALRHHTSEQLIALGVERGRAATVLIAGTIMSEMLGALQVHEAMVSDKGLRDGVALELYRECLAKPRAALRAASLARASARIVR
jgi:exopolyphosphatase/guanosine-5'-triphosphate,3'-diphosphate pyrophosphatase